MSKMTFGGLCPQGVFRIAGTFVLDLMDIIIYTSNHGNNSSNISLEKTNHKINIAQPMNSAYICKLYKPVFLVFYLLCPSMVCNKNNSRTCVIFDIWDTSGGHPVHLGSLSRISSDLERDAPPFSISDRSNVGTLLKN
jgi:hypothetical protein